MRLFPSGDGLRPAKGNLVNIPEQRYWRGIARQRHETAARQDGNREESSFLFNAFEFAHIAGIPLRRESVGSAAKRDHLFDFVRRSLHTP